MKLPKLLVVPLVLAAPLQAQLCAGSPSDGHPFQIAVGASESEYWRSSGVGVGWYPTDSSSIYAYASRDEGARGEHWERAGRTARVSLVRALPIPVVSLCVGVGIIRDQTDGSGPDGKLNGCDPLMGCLPAPPPTIVRQSSDGWRVPLSLKAGYALELPWMMSIGAAASASREIRQWVEDRGPYLGLRASNWHGSWSSSVTVFATMGRLLVAGTLDRAEAPFVSVPARRGAGRNHHSVLLVVRL